MFTIGASYVGEDKERESFSCSSIEPLESHVRRPLGSHFIETRDRESSVCVSRDRRRKQNSLCVSQERDRKKSKITEIICIY